MSTHPKRLFVPLALLALLALLLPGRPLDASSHREAPNITEMPKVDGTDFYMFRSYEPGREDFVTIVANYLPLQDPVGGPNYFTLDPDALYEIHIDNDADAVEDLTFQFRFQNTNRNIAIEVGPDGGPKELVTIPLINAGPIFTENDPTLNVIEKYTMNLVRGDRRTGTSMPLTRGTFTEFTKPVDNIGVKSVPNYESYASQFRYEFDLPDTTTRGRVFVGQRKESFAVNLGEVFDLINLNPIGPENGKKDDLAGKNITSLILELPIDFLLGPSNDPVIGGWTTASLRQARILNPLPTSPPATGKGPSVEGGAWTQVSRLGSPLVNELVIGLNDKDRFNASEPKDDAQFLTYVTNPTLPELIDILFGVPAPNVFPRNDLVSVFLTGVDGLNQPAGVAPSEMLRLNTSISPVPGSAQSRLGVLDGDQAGFPNGRRLGDDVVDIELRVVMGALLTETEHPEPRLPLTDGVFLDAGSFDNQFPYLRTPIAGSPQDGD